MRRRWLLAIRAIRGRWLLAAGAAACGVLLAAAPAEAHPLGNFSVNELISLTLHTDRIDADVVLDAAELPTLQQRAAIDTDGDGRVADGERAAYAMAECADLSRFTVVSVDGTRVAWVVVPGTFGYAPGAAGLDTSRLTCRFSGPARLSGPATVDVGNSAYPDRVGWREITAAGAGVRLVDPPIPAKSVSEGLRAYPQGLLSSPLDVRSARLVVRPGDSVAAVAGSSRPARADAVTRWTASADRALGNLVGARLTPLVGMLAALLALALGAAHAALPGHGKTMMAAYLAGRDGRPRDAVAVGATVTLTHTGGVLALGLLLTTAAGVAGENVLRWLGMVSGGLVAIVGVGMLVGVMRRVRGHGGHGEEPHAHHGHTHVLGSGHDDHTDATHIHHEHAHADHGHGHGHDGHSHAPHGRRGGHRAGLLGMGVAGGLVPSPSALVVLLGAIGLGRTWFGVVLVVAYGAGMAATLTAAGLLLVRLRDRWLTRQDRRGWSRLGARLAAAMPLGTATLVLLVGLGLAGRAALGIA